MVWPKHRHGFRKQDLSKIKTPIKQTCPSIVSKIPVMIKTLSLLVVCPTITLQKKILDSLISKYKTKTISYITELIINTPRCNARQAHQIEDSPSNSKTK